MQCGSLTKFYVILLQIPSPKLREQGKYKMQTAQLSNRFSEIYLHKLNVSCIALNKQHKA